jgi:hypothetical protein
MIFPLSNSLLSKQPSTSAIEAAKIHRSNQGMLAFSRFFYFYLNRFATAFASNSPVFKGPG